MTRPSHSSPYQQRPRAVQATTRTALGATEFLQSHDKMSVLLPALARLTAVQKDCAASLPDMFTACAVLRYDSDELVVSAPNAALAAKLKQKLPKLQIALQQRGWQINAIRIKVQVAQIPEKTMTSKQLVLPSLAVSALADLDHALPESARNASLKAALAAMIERHGASEKAK
jgi:hypothetical protein